MNRTIIDVSILHTVPPSNLNRDDTGSPKTALFGGVQRARVSSQAWKRATRLAFNQRLAVSELGVRTKRVVELLGERIVAADASIKAERAQELATEAFKAAGFKLTAPRKSTKENPLPEETGYLVFLSNRQLDHLAEAAVTANSSDDAIASLKSAELKKALNTEHSVDISLFGRMVAEMSDLNVDASVQVAHAIGVHKVESEFDYFTAIDDHKADDKEKEDAGAGMIGTVEFNSSTLYRYATIDANALFVNLGNTEVTRRAVEAFLFAFVTSMPTGKQNTFANRTLPDAVVVSVRDTQPVNLVGAFEEPVETDRIRSAAQRLVEHVKDIDGNYGTKPVKSWVVSTGKTDALNELGEKVTLDALVANLGEFVASRLPEQQ
ncbi:type I-E CRISPR-associated protein Cas7/Cse4/CasC [Luethyella okanaganae]|uniref:Type I-E CRISPR-associated protein Cas7/Cse4/CasC n=1 Tax=Luethyella okanaganae TaxID=69372 RepID=A0ABW1VH63_9MICO